MIGESSLIDTGRQPLSIFYFNNFNLDVGGDVEGRR